MTPNRIPTTVQLYRDADPRWRDLAESWDPKAASPGSHLRVAIGSLSEERELYAAMPSSFQGDTFYATAMSSYLSTLHGGWIEVQEDVRGRQDRG